MSQNHYNQRDTRQQIKDFAHQLDATSYILRRLKLPVHKLRDVIDGLQGAAGGRSEFELSFLALARRLRHAGSDEAAETYAQRKVSALDKAQRTSGRMLFTIMRGGGSEHKRTRYIDHVTPAANWMMQQARASDLWAKHPAKAIEAFTDEAIELLPVVDEAEDNSMSANPLTDDDYISRNFSHVITLAEKNYQRLLAKGDDPIAHAEKIARELRRRAKEMAEIQTQGSEGVQICTPSEDESKAASPVEEKPEMRAGAFSSGKRGFRTFPVHWIKVDGSCSCKNKDCSSPGKHPRISEWQKLASTDESWIKSWWKSWPDANVGIVTGEASGIFALDIDPRHGGDATLTELIEAHGDEWLHTSQARTGGGGHHIIFKYPKGAKVRNSKKLGEGIDVRGEGGFIVAPPSLHASGRHYAWLNEVEPVEAPEWLIKLLTDSEAAPAPKARSQAKSSATIGAVVGEGERNETLFSIGCAMRGQGYDYAEIKARLLEVNQQRCSPPLSVEEVQKIARSAARYAVNQTAVGV